MEHLDIHPLTSERWDDLAELFGEKGAVGGCWCMWWRLRGPQYAANAGDNNRDSLKRLVDTGNVPGLLAYHDGQAVGWCSVAPREQFAARFNNRSPVFKPVDDLPVWSIVCYFIAPEHRGEGVARRLLDAAVEYARERGAEMIEAYPKDPMLNRDAERFLYTGTLQMYQDAGFVEVARRYTTMTMYIMRLPIPPQNQR
jgi:GNAT superfamily N-acetyltransferase